MDMTQTTSDTSAAVPLGPYTMSSSTTLGGVSQDRDPGSRIHGVVMSVVFIFILPIGALLVRVWHVKAHIVLQLIGWILFCMAFGGGVVASKKYNKSKNFASGHQILGILLLIALLSQWVLGWMNHRTFKKTGHSTIMGKIHLYLGPAIILFGWINGALGFVFAGTSFPSNAMLTTELTPQEGQPYVALPYLALIFLMILSYSLTRVIIHRRRKARGHTGFAPPGAPSFAAQGQRPDGAPHMARSMNETVPNEAPPSYDQGIQLQQYPSSQSLPQVGQAPVQPRQMV